MDQLRTATGRCFQSDYIAIITTPSRLYVRIVDASMLEVATVFGSPQETVQLWYGEQYLAGYTHLIALVPESNAIKVILSKE